MAVRLFTTFGSPYGDILILKCSWHLDRLRVSIRKCSGYLDRFKVTARFENAHNIWTIWGWQIDSKMLIPFEPFSKDVFWLSIIDFVFAFKHIYNVFKSITWARTHARRSRPGKCKFTVRVGHAQTLMIAPLQSFILPLHCITRDLRKLTW